MIYITTKNVKQIIRDGNEVRNDLIKKNQQLENDLDSANKSLKYLKNKAARLESDLFDSSIINDLYDKGIKNRDGYYRIVAYNPTKLDSKTVANAMNKMFGGGFDTKPIYAFNQLIKKIKSTNTDLAAYTILESNYK